ncbi:MAG: hypothetical protein ABIF11_12205 [Nitrospirota bacterium]
MIDDWGINVKVEAELVKSWIDTRKVDFSTINGVVHINGTLEFQLDIFVNPDDPEYHEKRMEVEATKLKKVESRLKRISGVRGVRIEFNNWAKMGDRWIRRKIPGQELY